MSDFKMFGVAAGAGAFRPSLNAPAATGDDMTTTVTITTVDGDSKNVSSMVIGDVAQKHVLRSFNPAMKEDDRVGHLVDDTKVLCAAIIQRMIDLRDSASATGAQKRAASIAITQCEALQMQAVKANFVQA